MTNADKFKTVFGIYSEEFWAKSKNDMLNWINSEYQELKTKADVQPVKHGRWNGYETCSVCGASKSYFFYCTETGDWDGDWNYCPNCGAKMDANELEKEMSKIAEMEMAYGEYLND